MKEIITLDMLNSQGVSVKKQKITIIDGIEYPTGEIWREAYINSLKGREKIQKDLEEKYVTAVFSVWGKYPTVE